MNKKNFYSYFEKIEKLIVFSIWTSLKINKNN